MSLPGQTCRSKERCVAVRIKRRIAAALVCAALVGGGAIGTASVATAAAPSCLTMMSHVNNWSITNHCGYSVTYTVIRPFAFDQKVTIAAGATKTHLYPYNGIK